MSVVDQARAILAGAARGDEARQVATAYIELQRIVAADVPLARAVADCAAMRTTLTWVQRRCGELLEENRALRGGGAQ